MIKLHRTSTLTAGVLVPAMAWAHEIMDYIKQTMGVNMTVEMPVGGETWQLRWSSEYESLAAYEAFANALRADPKYLALLKSGSDMFIPGGTKDELWRTT